MLRRKSLQIFQKHFFSKNAYKILKSNEIRQAYIDFFIKNHKHKFIRSSPVVPFCDPTVAFVNAGMNQFKSVFLGKQIPISTRLTNSQKCIRVGGKHNDLSIVGQDGYHHTFFEMLGNWSFGDYFKKEACSMALELLKGPLGIDMNRLYFTYFAGDEKLNLPPDLECYEIWRDLGISEDRILPFGKNDNFWEMGTTGPCGPCTEIHIDHIPNGVNRSQFVNMGRSDLTEIWNIVFIQYNRNNDGLIEQLPQKHIDTGMGFERLVAILQNKSSNYDTDLFCPIFEKIHKITNLSQYSGNFKGHELDTAYRIIADHARMITACLSDGMLPDTNQKLRRVLRTAIQLSENTFNKENLLLEIIPVIAEILGPTYPEMYQKLNDTLEIINYEQEIFKALRLNASQDFKEILSTHKNFDHIDAMECPGFVPAYKELQQIKMNFSNNTIPGQFLFKLYDTYGLNNELVEKLAKLENLKLNNENLNLEINKAKEKSKLSLYNISCENKQKIDQAISKLSSECPNTNDEYKYLYKFNNLSQKYDSAKVNANILGIIEYDGTIKQHTNSNTKDIYYVIVDKSNLYYESGGQQSDEGVMRIQVKNVQKNEKSFVEFHVEDVQHFNGNTILIGKFNKSNHVIKVGDPVELFVNSQRRTSTMFNHSATHLLNAAIRNLFKKVTYQMSSSVTHEHLKIELAIIGKKINVEDVEEIEKLIRNIIDTGCPIRTVEINSNDVINDSSVTLVPGEIYPENNLRLITVENKYLNFQSKELCCGTHVHNTKHLKNFCIVNVKQTSRAHFAFTAVTGELAEKTLDLANVYSAGIDKLENELKLEQDKHLLVEIELQKLKNTLLHSDIVLPYAFTIEAVDRVSNMLKKLKEASRTTLKEFIEIEMQNVLQQKSDKSYIIHFLDSSTLVESVPLQKATKLCQDRPIMVISLNDAKVKARCCVPDDKVNNNFNAFNWLNIFASVFNGQISAPKGHDPKIVCNMKARKIISSVFDDQLEVAIQAAEDYVKKNM